MTRVLLKNVSKVYGKHAPAVDSINFHIKDKEFFSILGPSGCGKTSTLRMIAGLEEITSGDIYFNDTKVNNLSPAERDIALAFENYALYPFLNVYQNIAFPLQIKKVAKEEVDKRVKGLAKDMGLSDILYDNVQSLSGGQQQRVGVARALIRRPSVFLLDEPISHLEAKLKEQMRGELRRIHSEAKVTTIYVTHDQEEAISMSDRICVMDKGKVQQIDSPKGIYNYPANEFVASFIGEPPMNLLNASIINKDDILVISINGQNIKLPDQYVTKINQLKGREVTVGIRPSDIKCFTTKQRPCLLSGELYFIELRDKDHQILYIKFGDCDLFVKCKIDFCPKIGTNIYMEFDESRIHIFDKETKMNINRGDKDGKNCS